MSDGGMVYSPVNGFYNLTKLIDQSMIIIVIGCGAIFVVAQGCIDLSVGVNLALSGAIGMWVVKTTELNWLLIPVLILVGSLVGAFNGILISKLKVPSFMHTIAMLIGVRGIVKWIQIKTDLIYLPASMRVLNETGPKIAMFVVIIVVMGYLFEYTKVGRYSQAIGENEVTAQNVGVPVVKMKVIAFTLSGAMAGLASLFSILTIGGTSQTMGSFTEMKVAMAIFLGGVLITGGSSAKIYKVLLGSLSITIIVNGLAIIGKPQTEVSQSVEGILLLLILLVTIIATRRDRIRQTPPDEDLLVTS
jgi:ribose transport system permease protein